jgi:hypothetical protein
LPKEKAGASSDEELGTPEAPNREKEGGGGVEMNVLPRGASCSFSEASISTKRGRVDMTLLQLVHQYICISLPILLQSTHQYICINWPIPLQSSHQYIRISSPILLQSTHQYLCIGLFILLSIHQYLCIGLFILLSIQLSSSNQIISTAASVYLSSCQFIRPPAVKSSVHPHRFICPLANSSVLQQSTHTSAFATNKSLRPCH